MGKHKTRSARFQGGDAARLMIRLDPELRASWQADADADAGVDGAPLGPWIRAMVQRARVAMATMPPGMVKRDAKGRR